jgi:hypothetical protein
LYRIQNGGKAIITNKPLESAPYNNAFYGAKGISRRKEA